MKFEKFGKYILLKKLATGGMAEIFLAQTSKTAGVFQFVVVKRILPQFSSNPKFLEMFKNEGRVTSHLKHANLVYINEFGQHKQSYYIAMEYVAGCSLKDLINEVNKKYSKFPLACVVHIIRSVASALHYIHNSIDPVTGQPLNLIHRDISPHNIMIGYNGDIKLIDFGIAKVDNVNLTSSGVVKGKFSYMSPEQIKGKSLDNRTDIFSLGTVMWETLTGKKLFNGPNVHSVVEKVKECAIPDVKQFRIDVPDVLTEIMQMALYKEVKSRYQHAEEMERHLNTFLNDRYKSFSSLDFQKFVKNLYANQILKERANIVHLYNKLNEMNLFENTGIPPSNGFFPEGSHSSPSIEEIPSLEKKKKAKSSKKKNLDSSQMNSLPESFQTSSSQTKSSQTEMTDTVLSDQAPISYASTKPVQKKPQKKLSKKSQKQSVQSKKSKTKADRFGALSIRTEDLESIEKELEKSQSGTYYKDVQKTFATKYQKTNRSRSGVYIGLAVLGIVGVSLYVLYAGNFLEGSENETPIQVQDPVISEDISNLAQKPKKESSRRVASSNRKKASIKGIRVFIESVPSGGSISVNGERIDQRTPALITIPQSKNSITISKTGYKDRVLNNISKSSHLVVTLQRQVPSR